MCVLRPLWIKLGYSKNMPLRILKGNSRLIFLISLEYFQYISKEHIRRMHRVSEKACSVKFELR